MNVVIDFNLQPKECTFLLINELAKKAKVHVNVNTKNNADAKLVQLLQKHYNNDSIVVNFKKIKNDEDMPLWGGMYEGCFKTALGLRTDSSPIAAVAVGAYGADQALFEPLQEFYEKMYPKSNINHFMPLSSDIDAQLAEICKDEELKKIWEKWEK